MKLFHNSKIVLALILVAAAVCFYPCLHNGFISWDENAYVLENPFVLTLDIPTIIKSFQTSTQHTYVALTTLSFAVDHALFGFNPFVFHLNNLFLHGINIILVYLLALQLRLNKSAALIGTLLFALHPIHVESVAWVTERKGLLSAMFYLLSMRFYISYIAEFKLKNYWLAVTMGILSILAKPMGYSLPLVFLLLDWFYQRKFNWSLLIDKIIPLASAVSFSLLTYSKTFFKTHYVFYDMICVWIWTGVFPLIKFLVPFPLSPLYELPQPISVQNPQYAVSILILLFILWIIYRLKNDRLLVFTVGFYLLVMSALIIRSGWKFGNLSLVADRFMYLPSMGFCLYFAKIFIEWRGRSNINNQKLIAYALILICLNLGVLTFKQTKIWKNNGTLWNHVISYYPDNAIALLHRALYFQDIGRFDLMKQDLSRVQLLDPDNFLLYFVAGNYKAQQGDFLGALDAFNRAQKINPEYKDIYLNRGNVNIKLSRWKDALKDFDQYLVFAPNSYQAYSSRGMVLSLMGEYEPALKSFNQSLQIYPQYVDGLANRGVYFAVQKDYQAALRDFDQALKLDPKNESIIKNRDLAIKNSSGLK